MGRELQKAQDYWDSDIESNGGIQLLPGRDSSSESSVEAVFFIEISQLAAITQALSTFSNSSSETT